MQGMASRFVSAVKRLRPEPAKPVLEQGGTAESVVEAGEPGRVREAAEQAMAEENWAEAVTQWKALLALTGDQAAAARHVEHGRALRHLEQFDDAETSRPPMLEVPSRKSTAEARNGRTRHGSGKLAGGGPALPRLAQMPRAMTSLQAHTSA